MNSTMSTLLDTAFSKNNGYISIREALKLGISESTLRRAAKNGELLSLGKGVYKKHYVVDDLFYEYSLRYSKGIYSAETALYLLGMSDRLPEIYDITFPKSYNTSKLPTDIRPFRESEEFYGGGMISINTPAENSVQIYSAERTLCDILRPIRKVEQSVITKAFKIYVNEHKIRVNLLFEFAKLMGVENSVSKYMEVLL